MNKLSLFKTYIEEIISTSLTSWSELVPILTLRDYKKGDFIVRDSQEFSYEAFLSEGVLRVFLTDNDNREVNIAFYEGPEVIAPYFTRNINNKHIANFQAIENCTLILFDAKKFSELIRKYLDIRSFAYSVVEKELKLKAVKEKIFVSQPAAARLEFFRKTYPGIENKIPQHHIASYLGISPVSLSRLRKSDTK